MHTALDDNLLGTMRFISRHEDSQVYGAIFPKSITYQAMLDSVAYKTYYAITSGAKPLKLKKPKTKSDSTISSEETPSKKKPTKAKNDVPSKKKPASKPKLTKNKAPVKADRGNVLNVLSEVALSEAAQLKEAKKGSKKDFHISQASGSGDGTDFESGVPDEQHRKTSGADEGTEEDGDDSDGNDDDDDNDGDDDDNDGNDDDSDQERTESDRDEIPNLNQFNEELYKDVNVNLRKEDVEMTDVDQGGANQHNVSQESGFEHEEEDANVTLTNVHDTQKTEGPMQSSSVSSNFTDKLLNFKNVYPADNEIASLMDTTILTKEPSATPTQTASEVTTIFPALLDFSSVFKFNDRVTKLETDLSEMKQVDQYAQAISSIPIIVDRHINNKLGEAIHKAIQEEVKTQLPQILPKAVSDFATLVIERNVTESLEVVVLGRSNEGKSSSSSKDTSCSHHKSSGKSSHSEDPSQTVDDSGLQKNQEFNKGNNDEQPGDEVAPKYNWFKKPERDTTPDPDWNKRQQVDIRPPQTWISVTTCAEKPPTSFDELIDTPIYFSAFIINRLNITNMTQELLVGPSFILLKSTCKILTELEYHFEE
ncbi:hypothetical protein Tco_0861478 [Tanacetum coccineum]|uniref:Uncharacterized protein n=1 Tax=Tanacetum coccineum TaxID=301880 RepID=A0ABQ5BHX4_9ASTR